MAAQPKTGDLIRIRPDADGTAAEYSGETVAIVDVTLNGEVVWFKAYRDPHDYDAPLTEDEWEPA